MSHRLQSLPAWAYFSLVANALLLLVFVILLIQEQDLPVASQANASTTQTEPASSPVPAPSSSPSPELGTRHQLTYEQWVAILRQEAEVAAEKNSRRLTVLLGDSLSLWFPPALLPLERTWLNQGISGETSGGLLNRLRLFDQTQPEAIFVMIGINDLLRGIDDSTLLSNQWRIIHYLKTFHPNSKIVVQSILPHAAERTTWEGRDRMQTVPNSRIRNLNQQLASLAQKEGVYYLNLHNLFIDAEGNLRSELTTDGLHLNQQGYWVWRSALQLFSQLQLEQGVTEIKNQP